MKNFAIVYLLSITFLNISLHCALIIEKFLKKNCMLLATFDLLRNKQKPAGTYVFSVYNFSVLALKKNRCMY